MRWCLALVVVGAACGSDPAPAPVAELADVGGRVEASVGARSSAWKASGVGARFRTGDAVRTGSESRARVRVLRGNGILRMGPLSLVRFGADVDGVRGLELETGEATIEAGEADLAVATPGGRARVPSGTVVRVRRGERGTELEVIVGEAMIERTGEAALAVAAGATVQVASSGAIEPAATIDAGVEPPQPPDAGPLQVGLRTLATPLTLRGRDVALEPPPARTSARLPVGETVSLYAPSPPARVHLDVADACPADAVVEVRNGRRRRYFRGQGQVAVALAAGSNRYRVYCNDAGALRDGGSRGTVRVLRGSGRRKVKTKAPRNSIEADGRKYRLIYQNRKPTIEFVWPGAPAASAYELVVSGAGGKTWRFESKSPNAIVRSGALPEGSFTWQFRVADGTAKSLQSRLVLDFDNAAPVAEIQSARRTDSGVEVRGVATEGSTVSIAGAAVALGRDHRFVAKARVGPDADGVAVRIVRPSGAIYYYVVQAARDR